MIDPNQTFADSPAAEKTFPWGCLIGGCLSVVLLITVGVVATTYATYRFVKTQLDTYTSTEPAVMPDSKYSEDQIAALKKRIDDFKQALEKGESPEEMVLTADDINALISSEKELKGKLFVKIKDGEITGEISVPTDFLPIGKGRYFNGSASLKASLENGVLIVTLDDAQVNGKPVPEEFLVEIRKQNLAKETYKDPKAAEFLKKFEKLTIEDDKIILTPAKKKPTEPTSDTPLTLTEVPTSTPPTVEAEISQNSELKPSEPK